MSRIRPVLIGVVAVGALLLWAGAAWCQDCGDRDDGAREKPRPAEGFQPGDDAPPGPRAKPVPPRGQGFGPPMGPPRAGRPEGPPFGERPPRGPRPEDERNRPGPGEGLEGPGPGPGRPAGPPRPQGPPRWPHEDWGTLEKSDPEMYKLLREDSELERQTRQSAMQYRQAPKDRKEDVQKELEKLVLKHFDVRQQRRALELKRLEAELQRLRDSIDQRNKAREQIVKKRVSELLGLDEGTRF